LRGPNEALDVAVMIHEPFRYDGSFGVHHHGERANADAKVLEHLSLAKPPDL